MARTRFIVEGRVQGVFYRASTQETATRLGLTGWVRNRRDGSVELEACGDAGVIDRLERWLWQGPQMASVTAVRRMDLPDQPCQEKRFEVRPTA